MEEVYTRDLYPKSNYLIGAKYKSTLLENKLTAISFFKISQDDYSVNNGDIVVTIHAQELRKLLPESNGGSFYSSLSETAQLMTGRTIGFTDPEKKRFDYISIITRATYEDGKLSVVFNKAFNNFLAGVKDNYTLLNCSLMMAFKSIYSFRLYELLKSKAFVPKGEAGKGIPDIFEISYNLAELKFLLGNVNANLDKVQRLLRGSGIPDYEKAIEAAPEKNFNNWYDFRRRVLEVAAKEINDKSDITVEFKPLKSGRGAKVQSVIFYVSYKQNNNQHKEEKILTEEEKDEIIDYLYEKAAELNINIRMKEARLIAEEAGYDDKKIEKAFAAINGKVDNVVGFLRMAIREDYQIPTSISAKKQTKNSFNNFQQNEYDFEQLEKELLANSTYEEE